MQRAVDGIVITGGLGALGRMVCEAALETGAPVAAVDLASGQVGGITVVGSVDLTDPQDASRGIGEAVRRLGGMRVLINLAGGFRWQALETGDLASWAEMFRANVLTTANASRAALPYLRQAEHGRIVNVGAAAALKADAGMGPYAAAKSGVHRLTESLADELRGTRITVNAVLPSIIDTPANRADMPAAAFDNWVTGRELAAAILFLASKQASGVTGALLPVVGRL